MKTFRLIRLVLIAGVAAAITSACTEKIDLRLNSSTPQLVIEGNVSDRPGPYVVTLSRSRLYNEDNSFQPVQLATVVVSDDAGQSDTLSEIAPGIYQTHSIQGTAGHTYHLQVNVDGVTYESYCLMHPPVPIDSLLIGEETNFQGETKLKGDILIHDPVGLGNSYRVVSVVNGYTSSGFSVHTDDLWDGKIRSFNVPHSDFHSGDTIQVQLWSIDAGVYKYFSEFNQNQNNFGQPAAPANPTSVFTPDALGYFSAHSMTIIDTIIP